MAGYWMETCGHSVRSKYSQDCWAAKSLAAVAIASRVDSSVMGPCFKPLGPHIRIQGDQNFGGFHSDAVTFMEVPVYGVACVGAWV